MCTRYTRCLNGRGTSRRARQTGAGEHRLGASPAAGGAATAAVVGEGGNSSRAGVAPSVARFARDTLTRHRSGAPRVSHAPFAPLTTFLGTMAVFCWALSPAGAPPPPLPPVTPSRRSDSPCHMHAVFAAAVRTIIVSSSNTWSEDILRVPQAQGLLSLLWPVFIKDNNKRKSY